MSKITRTTAKLFGQTASPLGDDPEIGQFGSALLGTYVGTSDIATIQSLPAWQQGFIGAVTPQNQYPPLPEMTGFGKVLSHDICYLLQMGIPEWDAGTTYYANSFCQVNGTIYFSITNDNINNNPVNDRVNWRVFENGGRSHNLFDIVLKDHILSYDDSYGFSLQGTYVYKEASEGNYYGYPDFYNKCIAEREDGTSTLITLGSNQITVSVNANGHIYYDIADKSVVDAYYASYGAAWYYGVDTTNERIFLPRNEYFFRASSSTPGQLNLPGAPPITHYHSRGTMDITGTFSGVGQYYADAAHSYGATLTGAFYRINTSNGPSEGVKIDNSSTAVKDDYFGFKASDSWVGLTSSPTNVSSSVYGRETNKIMVTSINNYLYIVTGNTVDERAITIDAALQNAISALEAQEQTSISNIDDAEDDAVDAINDAKDDALGEIDDEGEQIIADATEQADRAESEADRAEAAAETAVAGQMQADWTQNDPTKVDYIKNKPVGLVTETATQTLENKTISASDNNITNLNTLNFEPNVVVGTISDISVASSSKLASEYSVANALVPLSEQINEIQLAKNPNLSIIGDITLNSGNASSFSATDYLQFPYVWNFGNYTWTMQVQFTTSADVTTQQNIINSYYGVALAIVNGKFVLSISSNGTSWDIANSSTGTYSVLGETTYTLRLSWDGSDYKLAYTVDEETYTDDITVTSSTVHNATQEYVGGSPNLFGSGTAYPFDGTINLNKWNLTVNNLVVWYGMDDAGLASRANVSLNNLDDVGEARFTSLQTAVASKADSSVETLQNIQTLSSGDINLNNTKSIYSYTPSANTTFTFNVTSSTVGGNQALTFELYIDMQTVYSLAFPSTLTWKDGVTPNLSSAGAYLLVFRTFNQGASWVGNLEGVW